MTGRIAAGYLLLVGIARADTEATLTWMADKIVSLRLFPEPQSVTAEAEPASASSFSSGLDAVGGALLVVSQFTLYGDTRKGRRPSFTEAAPPEQAAALYDRFVALLRERAPGRVETGEFGALMAVELVNDGPVTLLLER